MNPKPLDCATSVKPYSSHVTELDCTHPSTGLDIWMLLVAAGLLLAAGLLMRKLGKHPFSR